MVKLFDTVFECNPWKISVIRFAPSNLRYSACAGHHQFERQSKTSYAAETSLGFACAVPDAEKGAFDENGPSDERHRTDPGQDLALWQMAVAHQPDAAIVRFIRCIGLQQNRVAVLMTQTKWNLWQNRVCADNE